MGVSLPLCCFSGCNTLLSGWMRPRSGGDREPQPIYFSLLFTVAGRAWPEICAGGACYQAGTEHTEHTEHLFVLFQVCSYEH
jgi:hypothetical protein